MIIFVPVLIVCLNGTCEFMQAKTYYSSDAQCRAVLDTQKQHMQEISRGKIDLLEGTCIEADVKVRSKTERDV
jgi:hypothetical protein